MRRIAALACCLSCLALLGACTPSPPPIPATAPPAPPAPAPAPAHSPLATTQVPGADTGGTRIDCSTAHGPGQKTVCADPGLARQDAGLAALYAQLAPAGLLTGQVQAEQQAWQARRDACPTPACVAQAYAERYRVLDAYLHLPDPRSATRLEGGFVLAGVQVDQDGLRLGFDPAGLQTERAALLQVDGQDDPRVAYALSTLTRIQVDTASPDATRLASACADGCTLHGAIAQVGRGVWTLARLDSVQPATPASSLEVAPDDPRHAAVVAALTAGLQAELHQPVALDVSSLREQDGFAFVAAQPHRPDGQPIDFAGTDYAQAAAQDQLEGDAVYALLQHKDARWQVVIDVIGPTDAPWNSWAADYGAPRALFDAP